MSNAIWVRKALVGTTITTASGERATILDIGDAGARVQPEGLGKPIDLPMRAIRATIALWVKSPAPPSPAELRAAGIEQEQAEYLVPLVAAVRKAPGVKEWVHAERVERRADIASERHPD